MMEGDRNTVILGSTCSLTSLGFITWLVFLILKITNVWDIPWFWVWFPLWIPWAVEVGLIALIVIVAWIVFLIIAAVSKDEF